MTARLMITAAVLGAMVAPALAYDLNNTDIPKALASYEQNQLRFNREYVGKTISFGGPVNEIQKQIIGGSYRITFGNTNSFSGHVYCEITDPVLLDKIVAWNKGDMVNVDGTIKDVWFGNLELDRCHMDLVPKSSS